VIEARRSEAEVAVALAAPTPVKEPNLADAFAAEMESRDE
jgi:hypothetical protein